jgi:hypothetical protein
MPLDVPALCLNSALRNKSHLAKSLSIEIDFTPLLLPLCLTGLRVSTVIYGVEYLGIFCGNVLIFLHADLNDAPTSALEGGVTSFRERIRERINLRLWRLVFPDL